MSTNNGTKTDYSTNGVGKHQSPISIALPSSNKSGLSSDGTEERESEKKSSRRASMREFEQPVILEQSPNWSRAILWALMGVTTIAVVWASVAKIEEAIPSQGKLEPTGTVKEVQAPVGGVVKSIYVDDGQRVKKGDRLLSLDPTKSVAQLASLLKIRTALTQENQFYQAQMRSNSDSPTSEQAMVKIGLPAELMSLVKSRAALTSENQLFKAQIGSQSQRNRLTGEQIDRLQSDRAELDSRVAAAQSEVDQLSRQLNQTRIQLASAKETVAMNQEILQNFGPLAKEGAMSRIQYLKQQQELRTSIAEVSKLQQEQQRLLLEIGGAKSKLQNTFALDRKDVLIKIADNEKQIAEIDTNLTKAMVENNKRLAEVESQISEAQMNLRYQEVTAPSDGTVFDLKTHTPGFVTNASEPLLKIVPDDVLTAKVFITNKDIGFVREGMDVDVRIDSFPFSEFGDVKGKLVSIGKDALPPDQINQYYRFPAKIRLERQSLSIDGRTVPLQSGMSITANVRVRERSVMSIFTDLFTKNVEGLRFVR